MSKAAKATLPTLNNKQQLNKIVLDSKGKPDLLAINLYWDEFRSWYNPKKIYTSSKIVKTPKLHKYGVYASYKELAKKYGVTEETIRKKLVKLEKLELLRRDFYTNKEAHKTLYNQLVIYIWQQTPWFFNPIGLDKDLIEELTPFTSYKYISSKYNNEEIVTKCHGLNPKDSHDENNIGYEQNNALNVYTPIQPQLDTPIQPQLDTPIQPQLDTNILRVNNLYTVGIERLFTVYNINNNNIRAREFDEPVYTADSVNNFSCTKKSYSSKISESVTNCHELESTDPEEQKSSYADNAFGFLTEPTQSASDDLEESENDELLALLKKEQFDNFEIPIDPEEVPEIERKNRKMLLSKALWNVFGEDQANEIQDICKFTELEHDKINIDITSRNLTEWERAKIRQAIRSVYGSEVKIVTIPSILNSGNETEKNIKSSQLGSTQNWSRFKSAIKNNQLFEVLNNQLLKFIELEKKVIIEAVEFFIDKIIDPGSLESLEDAILETGLTLELHTKNIHPEYKNFDKKPIVLTPEKVLKDKAWFENMKISDLYKTSTVNRLIEVKEEKQVTTAEEESVTIYDRLKSLKRNEKINQDFNDMALLALIAKHSTQE